MGPAAGHGPGLLLRAGPDPLVTSLVLSDRRIHRLLGAAVAEGKLELGSALMQELGAREPAPVSVSPDDVAFIQFSSGTTVEPKPICLTHRQGRRKWASHCYGAGAALSLLRRRVIGMLARNPDVFDRMLATNIQRSVPVGSHHTTPDGDQRAKTTLSCSDANAT